jgi:hypothetical protein
MKYGEISLVDPKPGRPSVVDEANLLYGSISWDNHQRPKLLNSATIAPEHCVQL